MSSDPYTPSEEQVRTMFVEGVSENCYAMSWHEPFAEAYDRWLAAHDARVRRDAALHEKQRIAGEVRFWASINHGRANEDMGDLLDLVAGDIDRIPEETP